MRSYVTLALGIALVGISLACPQPYLATPSRKPAEACRHAPSISFVLPADSEEFRRSVRSVQALIALAEAMAKDATPESSSRIGHKTR